MIKDLTVQGALDFAVETERIGQEVYEKLAAKHDDDPELKELFHRLADDEKLHAARLDELRRILDKDKRRELTEDERDYLRSVSWNEVFHGGPDPLAAADRVESRKDALEMAFDLERSTLVLYDAFRDILGVEPILEEVIRIEKQHLTQVAKYMMDPEMKFRGTSDSWT